MMSCAVCVRACVKVLSRYEAYIIIAMRYPFLPFMYSRFCSDGETSLI